MKNNFQRVGSISNTHAGREFEEAAQLFFSKTGISLQPGLSALVGRKIKKLHKFDLGSESLPSSLSANPIHGRAAVTCLAQRLEG